MAAAEAQATDEQQQPTATSRQAPVVWPTAAEFRQATPIIRLFAEIWAIPEVKKVGVRADVTGIYVHVLMVEDNRDAESHISQAERRYLSATPLHNFDLIVTPLSRVPPDIGRNLLNGLEIMLER